jgi:hypothetical protein
MLGVIVGGTGVALGVAVSVMIGGLSVLVSVADASASGCESGVVQLKAVSMRAKNRTRARRRITVFSLQKGVEDTISCSGRCRV